jgi:hypothetical protein
LAKIILVTLYAKLCLSLCDDDAMDGQKWWKMHTYRSKSEKHQCLSLKNKNIYLQWYVKHLCSRTYYLYWESTSHGSLHMAIHLCTCNVTCSTRWNLISSRCYAVSSSPWISRPWGRMHYNPLNCLELLT